MDGPISGLQPRLSPAEFWSTLSDLYRPGRIHYLSKSSTPQQLANRPLTYFPLNNNTIISILNFTINFSKIIGDWCVNCYGCINIFITFLQILAYLLWCKTRKIILGFYTLFYLFPWVNGMCGELLEKIK